MSISSIHSLTNIYWVSILCQALCWHKPGQKQSHSLPSWAHIGLSHIQVQRRDREKLKTVHASLELEKDLNGHNFFIEQGRRPRSKGVRQHLHTPQWVHSQKSTRSLVPGTLPTLSSLPFPAPRKAKKQNKYWVAPSPCHQHESFDLTAIKFFPLNAAIKFSLFTSF